MNDKLQDEIVFHIMAFVTVDYCCLNAATGILAVVASNSKPSGSCVDRITMAHPNLDVISNIIQ